MLTYCAILFSQMDYCLIFFHRSSLSVVKPFDVEVPRSMGMLANSWNLSMYRFLKHCMALCACTACCAICMYCMLCYIYACTACCAICMYRMLCYMHVLHAVLYACTACCAICMYCMLCYMHLLHAVLYACIACCAICMYCMYACTAYCAICMYCMYACTAYCAICMYSILCYMHVLHVVLYACSTCCCSVSRYEAHCMILYRESYVSQHTVLYVVHCNYRGNANRWLV